MEFFVFFVYACLFFLIECLCFFTCVAVMSGLV